MESLIRRFIHGSMLDIQMGENMEAYEYIIERQIQWAKNRGISLVGSRGSKGRPAYTRTLDDNLFEPLLPETRKSFQKADGHEISHNSSDPRNLDNPSKMQAVHSSSALSVNVFQYWQKIGQVPLASAACGFCRKGNNVSKRIVFEDKYPIDKKLFRFPPNIDLVIHNADSAKG